MLSVFALLVACVRILCTGYPLPEPAVTDSDWVPMNPGLPGVGPAGCGSMVARGTDVYVAGGFRMAGDAQANGVARWDGQRWHAVGAAGRGVNALALDSSGNLYAAGSFTTFGGVAANNVAKWDGVRWSALASGLDGPVYALAVDRSGNLYAGGFFQRAGGDSAKRIAMWDGTRWKPVGGGADSMVWAFAQDASGNLYAGGDFSKAGGVASPRVARWDGTTWSAVGTGMDSSVLSLTISGSDLYAGGKFTVAGGIPASRIARWDGAAWHSLGSVSNFSVEALTPRPKGGIYAAGQLYRPGGSGTFSVASWDGQAWSALDVDSLVIGLALATDTTGTLFAGGINYLDGISRLNIEKWDGQTWSAMGGGGFYGTVSALAGDTTGTIYFASQYYVAGGLGKQHVMRWSQGVVATFPDLDGQISSLALGSDGSLFASGTFGTPGTPLYAVARWSNGAWSALGAGVVGSVGCLLADTLGNLYAGGDLTQAGGVGVDHVAKWDGKQWSSVGTGVGGWVRKLVAGDSGALYAAGDFPGVKKWNGQTWSSVGSLPYTVGAIARDDSGFIYASVMYTPEGAETMFNVLRWNGKKWELLGKGFYNQVISLVSDGNTVYAGGAFRATTDARPSHIARWTGATWEPLGSGTDGSVWVMLINKGLVVGGEFGAAGPWGTPGLARVGVPFRRQSTDVGAHKNATYGDAGWNVRATSALPVVVTSSDPSVARASGDSVSVRGAGRAVLSAYQAGDKIWLPVVQTGTLDVLPKPISPVRAVAQDRVYDATTAAAVVYDSLGGVLLGDSVVLVPGVARFSDRHAGDAKLVTDSGVSLSGRSARNYTLVTPSLHARIHPRPDTVKALPAAKAVGASDPDLPYSASPLCLGDARTGSLSRDPGDTVGTYAIRIGTLSDGPDYAMVFETAPFQIDGLSALASRPAKKVLVTHPSIRLDRAFAAPSGRAGPAELSSGQGSASDYPGRVDLLLPSPGSVSVSIFDHMGTPVIGWSDHIDASHWRQLPSSGDSRRILSVHWNLRAATGAPVATGVYLWKVAVVGEDGQKLEQILKFGVYGGP